MVDPVATAHVTSGTDLEALALRHRAKVGYAKLTATGEQTRKPMSYLADFVDLLPEVKVTVHELDEFTRFLIVWITPADTGRIHAMAVVAGMYEDSDGEG